MKQSMERKPFNEFWMNCMLNQAFSIAVSEEPSYRDAAYLNIYRYYPWEAATDKDFRYPTIDTLYYLDNPAKFPLSQAIRFIEPGHFRSKDTVLEEIRDMLRGGRNLSVNVDLYDWLPGSMAWKKFHWYHYSLFNGYDEERGTFYVIDDTLAGYEEHEVPSERLLKAYGNAEYNVNPNYMGPAYYVYNLQDNIQPYELKLAEVVENAERLVKELGAFSIEGMWNVDPDPEKKQAHLTYGLVGVNIICNRHVANTSLLRSMQEKKLISEPLCQSLSEQLGVVRDGWDLVKDRFVTGDFERGRELELANDLFAKEKAFWTTLAAGA
ncbi:hypothetical protein [Paenibacillus sp. NPDC057967]|uniref:hypothetical protein n=1 Tax=Paenibacillus sp. NPDC057967 TaxID=3346293 RepID=UPI0036DEB58F